MKRILFGFIVFAFCALFSRTSSIYAQGNIQIHVDSVNGVNVTTNSTFSSASEYIQSYNVESDIHTDGSVGMTERIQYVFPTPRHGILRQIPYIKTNSDGKKFRMTIDAVSVKDDAEAAYPFTTSDDGTSLTVKIGDPDKTISGSHWYVISYTVRGALTYFSDHDELYWNATGNTWPVPIASATMQVKLPENAADADITSACFTGSMGSTEKKCSAGTKNHTVNIETTQPLQSEEGLTVVVGFPKHIAAVLDPIEEVSFFSTLTGKIVLIGICIAVLLWYIIAPIIVVWKWWTGGRDPKPAMGEVKAWFSPPKTPTGRDLTPAETGGLIDETVNIRDIYGTIIDLARRGYIKITETSKGKFTLTKEKSWDDSVTLPFERTLLAGIFKSGDSVKLSDLNLTETIHTVSNTLYTSLVSDGFFPKNPQTIRIWFIVIAVLSAISFNPVLLLVSLTFGLHMPRKTLFGSEQAAVARSLKNFLSSQDKQLAFQAKNQMMFEKLLPYAIAFGVEVIWAKRFSDMVLKSPGWYESGTGGRFNSVIFAQSLGRGYSTSFAAAATYKSSSGFSSGFSGGGFSGGGGGGGGGGSW